MVSHHLIGQKKLPPGRSDKLSPNSCTEMFVSPLDIKCTPINLKQVIASRRQIALYWREIENLAGKK